MSVLDLLIPKPALVEIDCAELAVDAERAWRAVRDLDLAESALVRTLFADRLKGEKSPFRLRLDDLTSTEAEPGFQVLVDDAPHEVAAGAIGKVWRPIMPFVHVPDGQAFAV